MDNDARDGLTALLLDNYRYRYELGPEMGKGLEGVLLAAADALIPNNPRAKEIEAHVYYLRAGKETG